MKKKRFWQTKSKWDHSESNPTIFSNNRRLISCWFSIVTSVLDDATFLLERSEKFALLSLSVSISSTDVPKSVSRSVSIVHRFWLVFSMAFRAQTELMHVKFLLRGQHWYIHVEEPISERRLWVRSFFSIRVLFVSFGRFVRSDVGINIASFFTSRISLKPSLAFLCSAHLVFFSI